MSQVNPEGLALETESMLARPRILVVDDDYADIAFMVRVFGDDYELLSATDGESALRMLETTTPDLILLDVIMPGIGGFEVCKRLRLDYPLRDIPVIFVTALGDAATETRALAVGGTDFVSKPINPAAVRARVSNQIMLKRSRERLNEQIAMERSRIFTESLIESSPAAILVTDLAYTITAVNAAVEKMLWYKREELLHRETPLLVYDPAEVAVLADLLSRERGTVVSPLEAIFSAGEEFDGHSRGERTLIRKGGSPLIVQATVTLLRDQNARGIGFMITAYDVSERRQREEYISHLANHDALTGLPTRPLLGDRLQGMLSRAKRYPNPFALLMVDLNNFKQVNDAFGHHFGDLLLVEVSQRLRRAMRETDTVARMGGDEFVVLAGDLKSPLDADLIAEKLLCSLSFPFSLGERHRVDVTASVGVCLYPEGGGDAEALMRNADIAMYRAKGSGRNSFQTFTPEMARLVHQERKLEAALRNALSVNELQLHYQPQFSIAGGELIGVEALLRWNSQEFGPISPAQFIPIAERTGLILPIGAWVIRTACHQLAKLHREFGQQLIMGVNLSARQVDQPDLLETISASLQENVLDPSLLEIEVTESLLMSDSPMILNFLEGLRNRGIRIAIDDFGTGYSSMSYLLRFSVNRLKIDRCFIQDCSTSPNSRTLTTAIVTLAHQLDIEVVAEGVESKDQHDFLKSIDCDDVQGFYTGRPVPPDLITATCQV